MTSEWIMSEGGPLVVIDDKLKQNWGGIFRTAMPYGEVRNDYDRACHVRSHLESVAVVGGAALIVGDIPMDSCFWQAEPDYFAVLQVCYCKIDFVVGEAMKNFKKEIAKLEPRQVIEFRFSGDDLVMFDSSDGGDREPKLVSSALSAGCYAISTYTFEPDEETSLVIHAFRRQP